MQPTALLFAEERRKRPWAGGSRESGLLRRRASRKRARRERGRKAPIPGGLVQGSRSQRLHSGLSGARLERSMTGSAGLFSRRGHEHTTRGVRGPWIGVCPLRREKSRRAVPGRSASRPRAPEKRASATSPRKRRSYPQTTSDEVNLVSRLEKAAAPPENGAGNRASAYSLQRRSAGVRSIPGCARGSHVDCSAGKRRSGLRASGKPGHEAAAPRESGAMQRNARSNERLRKRAVVTMGPRGSRCPVLERGRGWWAAERACPAKALWIEDVAAFDEAAAEAVLALSGPGVQSPARGCDRERQRQGERPAPGRKRRG